MLTTIFGFLGGSAFRAIWGEIASFFKAKQDHQYEIERMRLEGEQAGAAHLRTMEMAKLQAELGIKVIEVQAEADVARVEADAWLEGVKGTTKKTGIVFVDIWNGMVRPMLATECMILWSLHLYRNNWMLDDMSWGILGAALGVFVADRTLTKLGRK